MMDDKELRRLLEDAYYMGFEVSGEGYNSECPFDDADDLPINDAVWRKNRDLSIDLLLEPKKYRGPSWT